MCKAGTKVENVSFGSPSVILELKNVWKSYNGTPVLRGVNLKLQKGDFVAVIGPSGSGKSTLLHIAGGLETPDRGGVFLYQKRIDNLPEGKRDAFRRKRVAYVFQFFNLLEDFTVWENIYLFGKLLKTKDVKRKTEEIISFLGLKGKENLKPLSLSGGERQRVAIGRALITEAGLILADEPTGNLDAERAEEIIKLFRELNERGITFLIATHNRELLKYFKKVYYINKGLLSDYRSG
jgi:lipoprotein-releasing system ATP-binding protein